MCCSSSFEKAQSHRQCRIGLWKQWSAKESSRWKMHQTLFPFEIGRCPAVPSDQYWQKSVGSWCAHLLSSKVWPEVIFMEGKQGQAALHKTIGTQVQKNGSRWSGLISQNEMKYLAAAEGGLFTKELQSGIIMSVMVEVPCKSGAGFRQMRSALMVYLVLRNTDSYLQYASCNTIREASDWPQISSAAGQRLQTYSQCHQELSSPKETQAGSDGTAPTEPWHQQICLGLHTETEGFVEAPQKIFG